MNRPIFLHAFGVLTAGLIACGGKVAGDDLGSGNVPGDTSAPTTGSKTGPPHTTEPPISHPTKGPPPPVGRLTDGVDFAITTSSEAEGTSVSLGSRASFDANGNFLGNGSFDPPPAPAIARSNGWLAWGSALSTGAKFFYAIGKKLPSGLAGVPLPDAQFALKNGGHLGDITIADQDISAYCSLSSKVCKIAISLQTATGTVQFVPAATIDEKGAIDGKALSGASRLVGALTCADDCPKGRLDTFGMVLAYEIEDPDTGTMHHGAAALPYFDPK